MRKLLGLAFIFIFGFSYSQTEHQVLPSSTDAGITTPNYNHFVYINQSVTAKNKLFLFFPGTGGFPANTKLLLKHAANLGYHSIGLTYPNVQSINELCIGESDTTCHSRARLEVFDGTDRHDSINVDTANSIQNRVIKLLQHLSSTYPSENWSQYYSGSTINWNKIMVSGHSQGGGHAGIISKLKPVDRVIMFAATDWIQPLSRYADWISWTSATSSDKYYGFIHQQDEAISLILQKDTWVQYGMHAYGSIVFADTAALPYNNTHQLYTNETPNNNPTKFHGCVVADLYTPMNGGVAVFEDVWTHLIDSQGATSLDEVSANKQPKIYPNPSSGVLNISEISQYENFKLFDVTGRCVQDGKLTSKIELTTEIKSGVYYFVSYNAKGEKFSQKLIVE